MKNSSEQTSENLINIKEVCTMKRKIVTINEEKCNGCGLCVTACHEGALQLVNGKAKLVSDSYCDGLGDCLPECPTGAITIEEREAAPYDEEAVKARMQARAQGNTTGHGHGTAQPQTAKLMHPYGQQEQAPRKETASPKAAPLPCGCPGTEAKTLARKAAPAPVPHVPSPDTPPARESQLRQWPCQIKLVPVNAPYLENAHLLIAADCTAYAYANIHQDFMRNKITLIGCPKLDDADYAEKLAAILEAHAIKSITILRMEVPCCGGLVNAIKAALLKSGKLIPWRVVTISTDGTILED
jgi:ferredoxin